MAEISKTAAAAIRAGKKGQTVGGERTWEQVLTDMRKNLDGHLSVPPMDISKLLESYLSVRAELENVISGANSAPDAPEVSA